MKSRNYLFSSADKSNYIIILIFIALSLLLVLNHEPWRDESSQWLIARDSQDLVSFFHLIGYGGNIGLWPLILFALAKLGLPYFSMSALHSLLMLTAVAVFISYAPFSKIQKFLFAFGYYPLYEYNVIARCYVLSVLFLFLIAMLYKNRFAKPVFYALLVLLLANTNVHSLVMAIVLGGVYVYELVSAQKFRICKRDLIPVAIIIFGISLAIFQLLPHPDQNQDAARWNLDLSTEHISTSPRAVIGAFLPIPRLKINFWAPKLLRRPLSLMLLLGLPLFLFSLSFFIKKPRPLLIYLLSCTGLFGIFFFKIPGSLRHHGLIFIFFIFSLWIANEYRDQSLIKIRLINKLFKQKYLTYLLTALLFIHVPIASVAFYYELNYDFSAGKRTAAFLKENGYIGDDTFIATYLSTDLTPILPYIPKPYSKFYFVGYQDFRSFTISNTEITRSKNLAIDGIIDRVDSAVLDKNYTTVLLILGKRMIDKGVDRHEEFSKRYNLIAYFDKTIVDEESFYIYQLKKTGL